MFCNTCGAQLNDGAKSCPVCGRVFEEPSKAETPTEEPIVLPKTDSTYTFESEPIHDDGKKKSRSILALVMSALGAYFCTSGLIGLIFSIIGKKQVAGLELDYGPCTGMAKIAKILSKVGFIVSLICTILIAIYAVVYGLFYILMILGAVSESGMAFLDFFENIAYFFEEILDF